MSTAVAVQSKSSIDIEAIQKVLFTGNIAALKPEQKLQYYNQVCSLVGLNPLTKPFDFLVLNGKEVLYSNKGCAEQLRMIHKISIKIVSREKIEDVYVVTAEAAGADGRVDSSTGAVPLGSLKGEALANAMMKAETKAKRRVTLSICGLNMLDELEVETIKTEINVRPQPPEEGDGFEPYGDEYRVDFGQWNRKSLEELYNDPKIGPERMISYIAYLEGVSAKKGKPLGEQAVRYIAEAEKFLGAKECAPYEPGTKG